MTHSARKIYDWENEGILAREARKLQKQIYLSENVQNPKFYTQQKKKTQLDREFQVKTFQKY